MRYRFLDWWNLSSEYLISYGKASGGRRDGTLIKQLLAFGFGGNPNGDVQISAGDVDNDGIWEIICGHGEGGNSGVRVFKANGTFIRNFKTFGGVNAQGEVHLGKSNY